MDEKSGIYEYVSLSITEDSNLTVLVKDTDNIYLNSTTRSLPIINSFSADDALLLKSLEVTKQIINITSPVDTLAIKLIEKSKVTNIHTVMDSNLRQVFGKVEVTYAAPFLGDDLNITSDQIGRYTSVSSIADNVLHAEYKWASCHDNKLDGTYHPMPTTTSRKYHVGLWGTVLSDSTGSFISKPVVTINFKSRPIYYLKVSGDDKLNNYPVDFTLDVYNSTDTLVYTEHVINNNQALWYMDLNPVINDVIKVVLTINKINKPNQVFKITEFFNSIVETYYNNGIVNMHLLEELDYIESSVTLGAISSNELDVVLDNSTGKFNIMDPSIPLANLIKRNRRVKAWLGAEILPNVIEWYPLGTFFTTKWDIPDRSLIAKFTARDRLDVLNNNDFSLTKVYKNMSVLALYRMILNDAALEEGVDYIIDSSLSEIIIPYAWFDSRNTREALQRLTGCVMVQLYCDREGIINITNMEPIAPIYYTFKDTTNVISKDFPFVWNEITNYVEVVSSNYIEGPSKNVLETKETISIAAKQVVQVRYDFNTSPIVSVSDPVLVGSTDIVIKSYDYFSTGIVIDLENISLATASITNITVNGVCLDKQSTSVSVAKDDELIKENGTLKTSITHDFIQNTLYAKQLAANLLSGYKESKYDVKLNCRGNIGLSLRQKVNVEDYRLKTIKPYVIKRQSIDWDGSLKATVEGKNIL